MNDQPSGLSLRIPYPRAVQTHFGIDNTGWKVLVEAIYPSAKSSESVVMALTYCKARNLDPFKRPVHIVPMWDSKRKDYVETVWPSISELRTTAFRTGNYAGCDEAEFGPSITQTFTGKVKRWVNRVETWVDESRTVTFPEWCRIVVHRELHGRVCRFVGPKVLWLESYATIGASDIPNDMWTERPVGQLEKCAEAAALRKAFPEEIGNELTAEEMTGRRVAGDEIAKEAPAKVPGPPPPPPAPQVTAGPSAPPPPPPEPEQSGVTAEWFESLTDALMQAADAETIAQVWADMDVASVCADEADWSIACAIRRRVEPDWTPGDEN